MKRNVSKLFINLLFVILGLVCFCNECFSQVVNQPMAPEVSSIAKYLEIPVSTYTGIPNTNIPIYEIKVRDLSIPISLSYHSSGIKVEEEANTVGLGWLLEAGGVVSRQIRGKDDFIGEGWNIGGSQMMEIQPPNNQFPFIYTYIWNDLSAFIFPWHDTQRDYSTLGLNVWDFQPDVYFYSIGGKSGKFFYDNSGKIQNVEQQKIKIEYDSNGTTIPNGWTITTNDGYKYYFYSSQSYNLVTTSWHLTKIVTPKGEVANYYYDQIGSVLGMSQYSIEQQEAGRQKLQYQILTSGNEFTANYLKLIKFSTGCIQFINSTGRRDLEKGRKLDKIVIWQNKSSNDSIKLKEFEFKYNYFRSLYSSTSYLYPTLASGFQFLYPTAYLDTMKIRNTYRLKLLSISEKSGNESIPPYSFIYDTLLLPEKTSFSRDHWGYYNGQFNSTLLPKLSAKLYFCDTNSDRFISFTGANREADSINNNNSNYAAASVLEKITYPTGGSSSFEYEPNRYTNWVRLKNTSFNFSCFLGDINIEGTKIDPTSPNIKSFTFTSDENPAIATIGFTFCWTKGIVTVNLLKDGNSFYSWDLPQKDTPFAIQYTINLPPGSTYTFTSNNVGVHTFLSPFASVITFKNGSGKGYGGGLRIAKITDIDPVLNTSNIRTFQYGKGMLMSQPEYLSMECRNIFSSSLPDRDDPKLYDCMSVSDPVLKRNSYSNMPLSNNAQGGYVGYDKVDIINGSGTATNGRTSFNYHNIADIQPFGLFSDVNVPNYSDCLNGYLLEQVNYDNNGNTLKRLSNNYSKRNENIQLGLIVKPVLMTECYNMYEAGNCNQCNLPFFGIQNFAYKLFFYPNSSQWVKLDSTNETIYQSGIPVTTSKSFYYDNPNHYQLTRTKTITSDNRTLVSKIKYPEDDVSTSGYIQDLKNAYMHSIPIEKINFQIQGSDSLVLSAEKYFYKPGTKGLLDYTNICYPPNGLPVSYTTYQNNYFLDTKVDSYVNNNPVQYHKFNNINTSYIWGYYNTLPVVKIEGIAYADISESIKTNISGRAYTNSSINTDVKIDVDYLKSQLSSLMTDPRYLVKIYTYSPLIGITSETPPNGTTTFYNYDSFGRLSEVKNDDGKLLKKYKYNYAK